MSEEPKAKPSKAAEVTKRAEEIVTLKPLKGYRSFLIAFLSILGGVLNLVNWNDFFNDWKAGVTAIIMGVLMGYMRLWSNTPPGESDKPWPTPAPPPPAPPQPTIIIK